NGQLIVISTAGEPGSEFEQTRERIRQSTAANITRKPGFVRAEAATVVLHEWAVEEDGNVEDLKVVKRANPLKAITVKSLQDKLAGPGMTLPHWRRLTCNLPTRSDSAAITESEWAKAKTTEGLPEGARIWVGLDVAWKWDTTAIVPLWVRDADFRLLGPAAVLTPPRDGQMLDIEVVKAAFMGIHARNPIHTVVMDPALAADLAQWVTQEMGSTIISRGQSTSLAVVDYQKFMEGLRGGTLKHSGDAGLTQHALNAIARIDRFGAARFDRSTPTRNVASEQDRRVIDALTAAAMVNAQALVQSEPTPEPFAVWA
ncbi:MAG: phage terminase family protein, partial [Actinomycetota bacterium]|nr:phage terminase family protein [Actinomycetota bacterium]